MTSSSPSGKLWVFIFSLCVSGEGGGRVSQAKMARASACSTKSGRVSLARIGVWTKGGRVVPPREGGRASQGGMCGQARVSVYGQEVEGV